MELLLLLPCSGLLLQQGLHLVPYTITPAETCDGVCGERYHDVTWVLKINERN
jgi:hypothetical protein